MTKMDELFDDETETMLSFRGPLKKKLIKAMITRREIRHHEDEIKELKEEANANIQSVMILIGVKKIQMTNVGIAIIKETQGLKFDKSKMFESLLTQGVKADVIKTAAEFATTYNPSSHVEFRLA